MIGALIAFLIANAHADYQISIVNQVRDTQNAPPADFLDAYRAFCGKPAYSPDEAAREFGRKYPMKRARTYAEALESQLRSALIKLKAKMPVTKPVRFQTYILFGCGKTDATSISGKSGTYVFFDIGKIFEQGRGDRVGKVFPVHELLHGVQFVLRPDFAENRNKLPELMIIEGAATYFSKQFTGVSEKEALWPDLLDDQQYARYIQYVNEKKPEFSRRIRAFLADPKSEPKLMNDLFGVFEMKDLETKRAAYFYGYRIVSQFESQHKRGLDFSFAEIEPAFREYFGLK